MYSAEQHTTDAWSESAQGILPGDSLEGMWGLDAVRGGYHELLERYHRLVELAPDGILVHDGERIVMANRAARRMIGASPADSIVGRPVEEFLQLPLLKYLGGGEVERAIWGEEEKPVAQSRPVRDVLWRLDHSPLDVEITAIPFLSHGRVAAHLIVRDLTERALQESAALRAASTIELLLEQLPATLWTTDAELQITSAQYGRRDSRGERFDAFADAVAPPSSDPTANELPRYAPGAVDAESSRHFQRRALAGEPSTYDVAREGKAFEVHVAPLQGADGTVTGIVGLALDVTERRQREADARAARETAVVAAIAAGVAHEVNNMMTVVIAYADMLRLELAGNTAQLADVAQIKHAALRASGITGQLLAFSRQSAHVPAIVEFDDVVEGMLPMAEHLLGEARPVTLQLGCGRCVELDRGQLEQVVVNLVLNARYAMATGGTLTLSTTTVQIVEPVEARTSGPIPPGAYAQLSVIDTGTGMDAHTAAHLFEPFFTTKALGVGTGLGLAAVASLMQQNHGHVVLESAPGAGATFKLLFPILPDSATPNDAEADTASAVIAAAATATGDDETEGSGRAVRAGPRILVVDDEPGIRQVVDRHLTKLGYRVSQAADGAAAIDVIEREGRPDLMLTDLIMPGVGGVELFQRVRARWPAFPVIFMSGYSEESVRREGGLEPGIELIAKPFVVKDVARKVAAALAAHVPG